MSLFQRLLKPSSWPINGKLAFAFLISALIPITLTAYFGYRDTLDGVRKNRLKDLQQNAASAAGRVDQLVTQSAKTVRLLQRAVDIRRALGAGRGASAAAVSDAEALMKDVLAGNEDIAEVLLLDRAGVVVAASVPARRGAQLSAMLRELRASSMRDIAAGHGAVGGRYAGLLLATPILGAEGAPMGTVMVMVAPSALETVLVESALRGRATPFVVDELGVLLLHPNPAFALTSVAPLSAEDEARIRASSRYGPAVDGANIRNLGAAALAARLRGGEAGHVEHEALFGPTPEATGYAPLLTLPWMAGVTESRARWEAPLREVYLSVIAKVLMVAGLAALAGVAIFARDLVQPVRRLIASAQAVRAGDYGKARAEKINEDEIGELTQTFNSMVDSIEKRDRERDLFGRMVSPEVREKMLAGQLKLGGENREVVVLFSDIRDFTTLCEGKSAEKVVEMLNEYLTEMATAVKEWDGYVNNFMGDAIMVVFGAPFEHPDAAWAAVQAAFGMRERLGDLNRRRQARGEAPIGHGIGLASGTVVAGQMGSIERFQYTVIGDAVNVAARLESLTKEYPDNPILATADIVEAITHHQWSVTASPIGERQLKGRSQATQLYSLVRRA
ncbi:MAG: HAMP domain-containing protein [Betaproteobacteria bacterium]|nr:HAMP domain-containing protein [Betaproteobacteria bacterium]